VPSETLLTRPDPLKCQRAPHAVANRLQQLASRVLDDINPLWPPSLTLFMERQRAPYIFAMRAPYPV
jgi:hypothetical protein